MGPGMTLKELLDAKLPQNLAGPRGKPTIYTISDTIGYQPQSVSEWFRKNQITIQCVEMLMKIEGHDLRLSDFVSFCPELKMVLDVIEAESGKSGVSDEH